MTATEFRRAALSLPGATEGAHMGHPDFRVSGKVFATLGYPQKGSATILVSPLDQDLLMRNHPNVFAASAGAWGRSGSTTVLLRAAPRELVSLALESAWKRRASKQLVSGHSASDKNGRGSGGDAV
jgi:hypothetical protein